MENCFCDEAFDAALELVSATLEGEAEVSLDAKGAEKVMEYFKGIFSGMCQLYRESGCCEEEEEETDEEEAPERSGSFVIKHTDAGYSFVLKAVNGEIIAVSEVYKTRAACMKGIASVRKNAPEAALTE